MASPAILETKDFNIKKKQIFELDSNPNCNRNFPRPGDPYLLDLEITQILSFISGHFPPILPV